MLARATVVSHGVLLVTTSITAVTFKRSQLVGRPIQSATLLFFLSGVSILFGRNLIPRLFASLNSSEKGLILSVQNVSNSHRDSDGEPTQQSDAAQPLRIAHGRLQLISVAIALTLRITFFHLTLLNRQCVAAGIEGFVPLILAIYNYWRKQHRRSAVDSLPDGNEDFWESRFGFGDRRRQLVSALCLSFANALQSSAFAAPVSTYICPLSSLTRAYIVLIQILGILLDCQIVSAIHTISKPPSLAENSKIAIAPAALGHILILSSAMLFASGALALNVNIVYRVELTDIGWSYVGSIARSSVALTAAVLAAVHVADAHGGLHLSMFLLSVWICSAGLRNALSDTRPMAAPAPALIAIFLLLLFVGVVSFIHSVPPSSGRSRQLPKNLGSRVSVSTSILLAILIVFFIWAQVPPMKRILDSHPVEMLMIEASEQANVWLDQASRSGTLADAVDEYFRRYQRNPPPGFDAWYRYATEKSSLVIDDFDSMMEDLNPFWGISPARIRELTQEVISDPWNEVSEVKIRYGHASLGPNFLPTHRWMLDGVVSLVKDFSQYLPDMDLAFNLNDEPRIAVPFREMLKLRPVQAPAAGNNHRWSPNRADTWETPADSQFLRLFEDHSRTNAFDEGTLACPPDSYAHKTYTWDPSAFCPPCAAPHSQGVFLSNWTLSASPCHQPDLRHLHGFYLSPAAFKPSHQLLPVFSQSKVEGYSDILYPSPWNYIDKVKYDPSPEAHPDLPFAQKENSLFWRGATSEGVSRAGTWKGMTRQRLVHLANNLTMDLHSPTLPILLPDPSHPGKYTYQLLTLNPISTLNLDLDISIVNGIARAWDNDGAAQDAEFGFAPPTDFQDHWRYRYLFDMDGAGFSGRFLPFLQSRSLPFRTGIFRSWWDSRLTAWKHFVPIDVRLHGLFSTLVYFMGAASPTGSVESIMKENVAAGEEIAEAGRMWSEKVLRKEDMEIYMFRLLLEWGRLTDDDRDEIGFTG